MIYYDGCYIAKYYLSEPDSGAVMARAANAGTVACSVHGKLETASVFHRKLREGSLTLEGYHLLRAQFEADCATGLWWWLPLGSALFDSAVRHFGILAPTVYLRSADALHLASAVEAGFREIHSSDRHLLAAAPHFGLTGVRL